jgi:hypothetical protein
VNLPYLNSGYNTFTFHWWYYYDFGILGVGLLPLLEGVAVGMIYFRLRTEPTFPVVILYASALVLMLLSYTMNPLNRLDFVSNIAAIFLLHVFLLNRNRMRRAVSQIAPSV